MDHTMPPFEAARWEPPLALRIERVCNRFEAACKAGLRPQIEHYLAQTPEPDRLVLLGELLAVEAEYRQKRGERTPREGPGRPFSGRADPLGDVPPPLCASP